MRRLLWIALGKPKVFFPIERGLYALLGIETAWLVIVLYRISGVWTLEQWSVFASAEAVWFLYGGIMLYLLATHRRHRHVWSLFWTFIVLIKGATVALYGMSFEAGAVSTILLPPALHLAIYRPPKETVKNGIFLENWRTVQDSYKIQTFGDADIENHIEAEDTDEDDWKDKQETR
jgi:hypothetical protein